MLKHKNQTIVHIFKASDKIQAISSLQYVLWAWRIVGKRCEYLFLTLDNWSGNHMKFLFIKWSSMWIYITDNISGMGLDNVWPKLPFRWEDGGKEIMAGWWR